jgi:murein DD-endopeptidase MepM/ murein hydrolase activator NlpD
LSVLSYLSIGVLFFVGLLLLQNYIFDSPIEKQLKSENEELKDYKVILTSKLKDYNQQLEDLADQDKVLYSKLFETAVNNDEESNQPDRSEILIAGTSDFNDWTTKLSDQSTQLNYKARVLNYNHYTNQTKHKKTDLTKILTAPSIVPVKDFDADKFVSGFGTKINPFHKGKYHHDGVDIAAPRGTEVLSASAGKVISVKKSDMIAGYGNYLEIDHGNGIITRYSHLEEIKVKPGQKLKKGETIGTVGSTGGSIAPHLHYEVIKDDVNVDPIKYFMEGITSSQFNNLIALNKKMNQSLD